MAVRAFGLQPTSRCTMDGLTHLCLAGGRVRVKVRVRVRASPQPVSVLQEFSMLAGDFLEVYCTPANKGKWDCIATAFFMDSAHNNFEVCCGGRGGM